MAAHANAALAELAQVAADFDDAELWSGDGLLSCAHWLTIQTGVGVRTADELLRVGRALRDLPQLRAAFADGRLSFDKMRLVTQVATPADDDAWLNVALSASGAQLGRICRSVVRCCQEQHGDADDRRARRGFWVLWRDDGLVDIHAVLSAEDAAVVLAALDSVAPRTGAPESTPIAVMRREGTPEEVRAAALDPAQERIPARRADALVLMSEETVSGATGSDGGGAAEAHRVVVHVDAELLAGAASRGRCNVEERAALPMSVVRRLGCDTELMTIVERDGSPLDVGRQRRLVSGRLRTAMQARDRTCRFPGCGVSAKHCHGHHIEHWFDDDGETDLDNVLSLCGFHHRRLHDDAFRIELTDDRRPRFVDSRGQPFGEPTGPALVRPTRAGLRRWLGIRLDQLGDPVALDGGQRFDLGYAVEVMANLAGAGQR